MPWNNISLWNEGRVELLKTWWTEGLNSRQISEKFASEHEYHVTRNAVIGKVHRLGLPSRIKNKVRAERRPSPKRNLWKTLEQKLVSLSPPQVNGFRGAKIISSNPRNGAPVMEYKVDTTKRVLLRKTEEGHCRAIIGYVNGVLADAICCGEQTPWISSPYGKLSRSPWCEHHRSVYIQPNVGRKR